VTFDQSTASPAAPLAPPVPGRGVRAQFARVSQHLPRAAAGGGLS